MTDTAQLQPLAPLAALIEKTIRDTPIRMGPGGTDDLTAQLTVKTCVWVGKNVLPRTTGLAAFVNDVDVERQAQLAKWGDQHHPDIAGDATLQCDLRETFAEQADYYRSLNSRGPEPDWSGILLEEVYEAVAEADPAKIRAELVQVAAVCAAWIHDLDSRTA